ncbi:MAG: class I SAM-dependent methyltransferase [Deltaproteobacteria bacterium]|nr:class I SAM-dependent methyltransferase [Deltaproteobacteria bacterium]
MRERTACGTCKARSLSPFLDLGMQPPANALLGPRELEREESRFPLVLGHCGSCGLIQLLHSVSPELLFRNYVYFSSVSGSMSKHFAAYAQEVADRFVPPGGLVVELGSNDGVLLRNLLGRPLRVLGVDPAENVAEVARERGVPTIASFFGERLADEIRAQHGAASVILANNVFAHVENLEDVMRGVDRLLDERGVFVLEVPYVVDFLGHLEFDTVYHEHLYYFGVRPLMTLFGRLGFEVFEVQRKSVHGGTIRVHVRRAGQGAPKGRPIDGSVAELAALEEEEGASDPARLLRFAGDVAALREKLCSLIGELHRDKRRVVGYGAAAKGNVLLNYCGLGPDRIEYLVDATPAKQGLFSPGMRIPIKGPDLGGDRPDYVLLLAWNHSAEIMEKEQAYRQAGGRFIVPIPRVEVV